MLSEEELRIGWGEKFIQARGGQVVVILLLIAGFGLLEYQDSGRSKAQMQQHDRITDALEVQTCIQSIPFEERGKLRDDLKQSQNPRETLRIGWCPWLKKLE